MAVQEDTCAAAGCVICRAESSQKTLTAEMRHRMQDGVGPIIQRLASKREALPQFSLERDIVKCFLTPLKVFTKQIRVHARSAT